MTQIETGVEVHFDAAHMRPYGDRIHGHTWTVRAWFPAGEDNRDLTARLGAVVAPLDHVLLDEMVDLTPSNEGIVKWLLDRLPDAVEVEVIRRGGSARGRR